MTVLEDSKVVKANLLAAQAARALSEARLFDAQTHIHEAELERQPFIVKELNADARAADIRVQIAAEELKQNLFATDMARIQVDEVRRIENNYLASNTANHVINFSQDISDETVKYCIDLLTIWDRQDPGCDVEIIFDNDGGSAWAGLHLFDYLIYLKKNHKVTITAIGKTASMAAILVQAATVRRMGANGFMMFHELSAQTAGKMSAMNDHMELLKKIESNMIEAIAARSNLTPTKLKNLWYKKDVWLTAKECLDMGLIDEIMQ